MKKRMISSAIAAAMLLTVMSGCSTASAAPGSTSPSAQPSSTQPSSSSSTSSSSTAPAPAPEAKSLGEIAVISREDGSGTRGAFIELFEVQEKGADGSKVDRTTEEATVVSKTDVMLTTVAGDPASIGYVSLGSLNDSVKAVQVEGVTASAENMLNGTYKISRPFNIATKGEATGLAKDFIDFIMSAEGQAVVSKSYVAIDSKAAPYAGSKPTGKIVVGGSSSVYPVMEKLQEAYLAINPNATIELQSSDSTAGMTGTVDGIFDIGMASRDLKDSEKEKLTGLSIAIDGIAVIVNPTNPVTNLTREQVKAIFVGETTDWSAIK